MSFTAHKDKDATLDYEFDWSAWLGTDTITASAWIVPSGITNEGESFSDTATLIWLSGGVTGETYEVVNRITTTGTSRTRIDDRTLTVGIVEK